MRWFRSNRAGGGWLALFALACQLVLAFGHVHLGNATSSLGSVYSAALSISAVAADDHAAANPSSPQKKPNGAVDDFCALCASINLAGTLVVPDAPAINPPPSFVRELRWSLAAIEPAGFDHFLFDARGPPHA